VADHRLVDRRVDLGLPVGPLDRRRSMVYDPAGGGIARVGGRGSTAAVRIDDGFRVCDGRVRHDRDAVAIDHRADDRAVVVAPPPPMPRIRSLPSLSTSTQGDQRFPKPSTTVCALVDDLGILRNRRRTGDADGRRVRSADGRMTITSGFRCMSSRWDVSDGPAIALAGCDAGPRRTATVGARWVW
jgi:hypothetical protein